MRHLHVIIDDAQYKAIKTFAYKHNVSLALATRFIIQWWYKDGPKEIPPEEEKE
jgi:hypothetical protein